MDNNYSHIIDTLTRQPVVVLDRLRDQIIAEFTRRGCAQMPLSLFRPIANKHTREHMCNDRLVAVIGHLDYLEVWRAGSGWRVCLVRPATGGP